LGQLIIIAAMFALLWLLLIRPQRQAAAKRARMVEDVDVGDEVLSSGGVYGVVRAVSDDDDQLFVEIAPGVEVRMDRRAVGAVVNQQDDEDEDDELEDAEEEADAADEAEEPVALAESAEPEPSAHGTTGPDRG
jgi:preprotein translocase subunit YajC